MSFKSKPHNLQDHLTWQTMPEDYKEYAKILYTTLHQLDNYQHKIILVETPKDNTHWQGIKDRLTRAAK